MYLARAKLKFLNVRVWPYKVVFSPAIIESHMHVHAIMHVHVHVLHHNLLLHASHDLLLLICCTLGRHRTGPSPSLQVRSNGNGQLAAKVTC